MKVKEKVKKLKAWAKRHDEALAAAGFIALEVVGCVFWFKGGYEFGKTDGHFEGMNSMLECIKNGLTGAIDSGVLIDESAKNFESSAAYAEDFVDNCMICGICENIKNNK